MRTLTRHAFIIAAVTVAIRAQAQVGDSYKVQAPTIAAPGRGSLAGSLAHTAFGLGDVGRGSMNLPSPYGAPEERGPLLASIFPSYSPEAGISEWGMGWGVELALRRWRESGDLDYTTDDLGGVFGPCKRGTDGNFYPAGLGKLVRIEPSGPGFIAITSDGTRWRFGQRSRIEAPAGVSPMGVFAWSLDEVETATGRRAALTYSTNASGRLFLTQVDYGGVAGSFQHRVTIDYSPIDRTFTDYRAGFALVLDRRVSAVTALSRNAATSTWERRFSFVPTYRQDDVGPAFYLSSVVQIFASGEVVPGIQYTYEHSSEVLASAALQLNAKFDTFLAEYSSWFVLPDYATQTDANADGLADFELASDNSLVLQGPTGFTVEKLPPAADAALSDCRPSIGAWNVPRTLAAMRAASDELQVVALAPWSTTTGLALCNRNGDAVFQTILPDHWSLGPATRLVDLNRDHQPDFIQVWFDGYEVIPNTSTATGYAFGSPVTGALDPVVDPEGIWLQDFNGDGLPDLVTRVGISLAVFFNRGHFAFEQSPRVYDVRDDTGQPFDPSSFRFTWLDADGDGLADLLLSSLTDALLFRNTGEALVSVPVGQKPSVFCDWAQPLFLDLSGSGNAEVTFLIQDKVYALSLNSPGTGLIKSADDGRGNRLIFTWDRAAAAPGLGARHPILSSVRSESLGVDPLTTSYTYDAPTLHSRGKYLVGYGQVGATTPVGAETATFLNGDDYSGLLLTSRKHDNNAPMVDEVEWRTYEDTSVPVPWKRLKSVVSGVQSADGTQLTSEQTDYLAYEADVCPQQVQHSGPSGTLVTLSNRAALSGLGSAMHCLPAQVETVGMHSDATLNFDYTAIVERNEVGQVTGLKSQAQSGSLTLQTATYDSSYDLTSLSVPGRGTSTFVHDPVTQLLTRLVGTDGVVTSVLERDPLSDLPRTIEVDRGAARLRQFFRYDGLERLWKRWDDLGNATEANPNELLTYRFASGGVPATVFSALLVDATTGARTSTVEYQTAGGDGIAVARAIPEGWSFGGVTERLRTVRKENTFLRPTLAAGSDPLALDYQALLTGATPLRQRVLTASGQEARRTELLHAGVSRDLVTQWTVTGGQILERTVENGRLSTERTLDAAKRVVASRDESGNVYRFTYDAMGRVRRVDLPDGKKHTQSFDEHGRVSLVARDGVASVWSEYEPGTGLLTRKTYLSSAGVPQRKVDFTYDGIGRVKQATHVDLVVGGSKAFSYFYDGATPVVPLARGMLGFLSGVTGDGFSKTLDNRVDGTLLKRVVRLGDWRTVETSWSYLEGGQAGARQTRISDGAGTLLSSTTEESRYDAYGRLQTLRLDGAPLATLGYDVNGNLASAAFSNGDSVALAYDGVTRRQVGSTQRTAQYQASTEVRMNARGLVDWEHLRVGSTDLLRGYSYSDNRQLVASSDARDAFGYAYDSVGLPTSFSRNGATRMVAESSAELTVGTVTYGFDALHRIVSRTDTTAPDATLTIGYGPDGEISTARKGGVVFSYVHDEGGQRLMKLRAGVPVAGYLDDGAYLDESGLTSRVSVGGRTVGVVRNGVFTTVATDSRGSVLAEPTGDARVASPYGQRDVHPAMAAALDYVEKGYDADLGLVRMGARDYDPETGRFTTPDPLFLESLEKCTGSSVECNLFGYAGGNPIAFVDPTGLGIFDISADTKTRAFGALRVIGGTAELALAGTAAGASGGTAAAFSFLLGVHGMDQIQAGLQQLIDGKDTDTMLSQSLQASGMGRTAANVTDAALGLGFSVGTGMAILAPRVLDIPNIESVTLDAATIRFSQSNVRSTLPELTQAMKANGWQGSPVDVVRMPDGGLTAVDNTRIAAASLSKTPVQAIIRGFNEAFPSARAGGNLEGATWGEAIMNRLANQKPAWLRLYPNGSQFSGTHPSTPGFSP